MEKTQQCLSLGNRDQLYLRMAVVINPTEQKTISVGEGAERARTPALCKERQLLGEGSVISHQLDRSLS